MEDVGRPTEIPTSVETGELVPLEVQEQLGVYTVDGSDKIEAIKRAEIGEGGDISRLKRAVERGVAFNENLVLYTRINPETLDRRPDLIAHFRTLFVTKETSSARPEYSQVKAAALDALSRPVRELEDYSENPNAWVEEQAKTLHARYKATYLPMVIRGEIPHDKFLAQTIELAEKDLGPRIERIKNVDQAQEELSRLYLHVQAREMVDMAFRQRQATSERAEWAADQSKVFGQHVISPDAPHWRAYWQYNPEFGKKTSKVLRKMIDVAKGKVDGIHPSVYARGFGGTRELIDVLRREWEAVKENKGKEFKTDIKEVSGTEEFANWFKVMLQEADGDIVAVWHAWKTGLYWEEFTHYSYYQTEGGHMFFADPPLADDLSSWLIHTIGHRFKELGLNAKGKRVVDEKFIGKSGHPLSLETIDCIYGGFLHETKIKNWRGKKDVPLFDIFYNEELDFDDPHFPWTETGAQADEAEGEPAMGGDGYWKLMRGRAYQVLQHTQSLPTANELDNPRYFDQNSNIRNHTKLKIGPEKRRKVLAGQIQALMGSEGSTQFERDKRYQSYRTKNQNYRLVPRRAGCANPPGERGIGDVLYHAVECGYIRKADEDWILNCLGGDRGKLELIGRKEDLNL